ncbi:UTP--glucose-1-phosphate uridylyltransferase [Mycoplasma tauri]|uniref:UTP--glucose-1-phosphate uridylyltransferase n=1 Tax=Mycoplasma tauri TaxID=547987 RepID=UPI001967505A|nr:UTP--glucose-1-phosphate uridylyltransferase [Mycoplasma tauri]MBZ4203552.1 UTP--glucose-1-phosphate uridylyltransferase [Mycoplasma tauri]MBZ4212897.1 UTP--glucose-1-phosphate uridylyltransferase [Mycoplasma tauri]MBZ4218289.1 UTP--glucose-1-phosphate uridylyltransferase [Mycoplasma tauri]MBZ4226675.1 UTP--glucose-1-phosphate uridylyltransferase [Mycoplasma tauri]QSB07652.1 UTP--glucose-1-phosphate uridylyltransferase [Mycoplasma tauri]
MNKEVRKVRKLIIPAAGWGTRFLPLTKTVHKELVPILDRPIIDYLVKEAIEAGIEEVILIISERKKDIANFFNVNQSLEEELKSKNKKSLLDTVKSTNIPNLIKVVIQHEQNGLGHALSVAKEAIENEPFAVILGDDLIKSKTPAIKQLIEFYNETGSNILGVQSVANEYVHKYGIVNPIDKNQKDNKYFEINGAVEKPKLEDAPSNKAILGRYVFNPEILDILSKIEYNGKDEIQVVDAFNDLMNKYNQKIYAFEFEGTRYDLGSIEGFVKANIDYALENNEIGYKIDEYIKSK